jgi:asparagine synthase (glutamine-hydrolysing)
MHTTMADAATEFKRLLSDSIRLQLRSDVPVGSCLSGGLDSSSIVCLVHEIFQTNGQGAMQRTFTSHFEEPEANEIEYMREVIEKTRVVNDLICPNGDDLMADLEKLVWHQEEPFGSSSIFAQWAVFKRVGKTDVRVMLDGQGADEQLAGYAGLGVTYFAELTRKRRIFTLMSEEFWHVMRSPQNFFRAVAEMLKRHNLLQWMAQRPPAIDWIQPALRAQSTSKDCFVKLFSEHPYGDQELLNNLLFTLTLKTNLPTLLRYEDRNSMAFSVEARVPFLDHRLVEFVLSLPAGIKINHGYTKAVLREAMRGVLPEKIRKRVGKLGFATPERKWQQTVLKSQIESALSNDRLREFIVPKQARLLLDHLIDTHATDFTPWRWLNLNLWLNCFDVA